jgi:hypothetical protein
MTDIEFHEMTNRMLQYGGSFVQALAHAMVKADRSNRNKLIVAFPEYVKEYGPESKLPAY